MLMIGKMVRYSQICIAILSPWVMGSTTEALASIGDRKGPCWRMAQEKFPGAELIGIIGQRKSRSIVHGYIIDQFNHPHIIRCGFRARHGKPSFFHSKPFAEGEKYPVDYTREKFERERAAEIEYWKKRKERNKEDIKRKKELERKRAAEEARALIQLELERQKLEAAAQLEENE